MPRNGQWIYISVHDLLGMAILTGNQTTSSGGGGVTTGRGSVISFQPDENERGKFLGHPSYISIRVKE